MWIDEKINLLKKALTDAEIKFEITTTERENEIISVDGRRIGVGHDDKVYICTKKENMYGLGNAYGALNYAEEKQLEEINKSFASPNPKNKPKNFKAQFEKALEATIKEEALRTIAGKRHEEINNRFRESVKELRKSGFLVRVNIAFYNSINGDAYAKNDVVSFTLNKYGTVFDFGIVNSMNADTAIKLFGHFKKEIKEDSSEHADENKMKLVYEDDSFFYYYGIGESGISIFKVIPADIENFPWSGYLSKEYACRVMKAIDRFPAECV